MLKLAEGTARILGILALSELIARQTFNKELRSQFRKGASFGTWISLIDLFLAKVESPRIQELTALRDSPITQTLERIKEFRNRSHHAHGVRFSHELHEDVEQLEPRVLSVINSVNWLSSIRWFWVERCEYLNESSFRIVGLQLRGSHPSWEPLEQLETYPLRPGRIYVDSRLSRQPVDLWPLAMVRLCQECRTQELFLLDQMVSGQAILRSLEEHPLEIRYSASGET
ncbi:hypothetical protein NOSIN_00220 [Nocardiopsis sinuspersici]|uniref:Uncharacterized protein n=1 Tax=Nocardiopsis sinuspersici TaxID=501010 RepID=A0A1V3BVQ9_9ACTN|nr:hypothetical protein NOSIN_00220 [Nocardiopsis sinuspersici]